MIPNQNNPDIQRLIRWFKTHQRDLPWRQKASPYAVWVSEVMLQQTQVAVVIPYFERWVTRFPTVQALADAAQEEVIKLWEGLGYYSRARNLHNGAKQIVEKFEGILPNEPEKLNQIKGLGPYTIGAIRSFAFHHKTAAVDGNVLRVLSRYYNLADDIAKPKTVSHIRQLAEALLPEDEHWIVNEALIELGATHCGKKLECNHCPLQNSCQGYAKGTAASLPNKTRSATGIPLYRGVAVIQHQDRVLLRKGEKGKVMQDLYEFPYCEGKIETHWLKEVATFIEKLGLQGEVQQPLKTVKHGFTKYSVTLYPHIVACTVAHDVLGYEWHPTATLHQLPFSSGHKRILQLMLQV